MLTATGRKTTTVRVTRETRRQAKKLAAEREISIQALLAELVEAAAREAEQPPDEAGKE